MLIKQYGVWMDLHHATIVGKEENEAGVIKLIAHEKSESGSSGSSEKNINNHEQSIHAKFFKAIANHMQNATHIHITGTGIAQEQFKHYLSATPQFKNAKTEDSTSNKMTDEKLLDFMKLHLK